MDGEIFVKFMDVVYKKELERVKEKRDELLLHRWGYELPLMEKVVHFERYREMAYGSLSSKTTKTNGKKNKERKSESNSELLARINKIKELDQKV